MVGALEACSCGSVAARGVCSCLLCFILHNVALLEMLSLPPAPPAAGGVRGGGGQAGILLVSPALGSHA